MKKQKVNWLLYLILSILSIKIIVTSLLVKNCDDWFTIISGIGCGAFASVVTAYLIELANVSQRNQKNIDIFEICFGKLYFSFAQLLSSLTIACDKEKQKNVGELYWFDWIEKIIEEQSANPIPSVGNFLIDKLKNVEKELEKVEENKLLLLSQDLIENTEIIALMEIKLDLSVIKSELSTAKINWSNIKLIIPELKQHIEESKVLKNFNRVSYKDGLSRLIRIRCYLKLGGKHVKHRPNRKGNTKASS